MDINGILNTTKIKRQTDHASRNNMRYLYGRSIPSWMWHGAGVGWGSEKKYHTGLIGIMNYIFSGSKNDPWRDAHPLTCFSRTDNEVIAIRRIIKGFIDHNISFLIGVESGKHINVGIGYRGRVSPVSAAFYIYTADPLDGWGRDDKTKQPGRWRRMLVSKDNLFNGKGLIYAIVCWNHHSKGPAHDFKPGSWGLKVDRLNGNDWFLGYQVPINDALKDPLTRKKTRRDPLKKSKQKK